MDELPPREKFTENPGKIDEVIFHYIFIFFYHRFKVYTLVYSLCVVTLDIIVPKIKNIQFFTQNNKSSVL